MRSDPKRLSNSTLITAVIVVLFMSLATELVLRQVRRQEILEAGEIQKNALKLFWELLQVKGTQFRLRDGKLTLGSYTLNGNNELPDKVQEITGSRATIFQGDTRIATNVRLPDGRRAVGTKLTGPAFEAIVRKGIPFRGETRILGSTYFTAYDPIRDPEGKLIGAVFVGAKQSEYLAAYQRTALRIRIINGTLTCFFLLCTFVWFLERKRSEEAMQKQLDFLQVIIDTIPSPVFYKDAAGRYLGFNKVYEEYVGLTRDQMLGKAVHDLWAKDLADVFCQKDQELFQRPGIQTYETSVTHSDGARHDVVMNKATFLTPSGSLGGLVGVMLDITERKAAEEETRNAYRKMADILEFLPDATFVVDQDNRVIAWNLAIESMTGVRKEQVLGNGNYAYAIPFYGSRQKILIDMLNEPPETLEFSYSNVVRTGKTVCAEAKVGMHNGERRIWSAASPLFDMQGNQVGGIQTLRDVTETRLAQEERNRLEMQLEHSTMVESLMSQLSHDLRTPLTPLFALLPLVRRKVTDPSLARMLEMCQECVTQIQGLTGKALDLVRLSSRAGSLELTRLRLAGIARLALEERADSLKERGIPCRSTIDAGLSVLGSAEQLTLLFDNLLSNAIRYARHEVTISASREAGLVLVSVQDDGAGLEAAHRELIFQEFFKVDAARHDVRTQGLGLAICKSIVLNHGGKIWAASPGLNLGTTISFTLQAAEPDATGITRGTGS